WITCYLVTLTEEGDLSECSNWRGIVMLSIPSKVLTRIILNRLRDALDTRLRAEQAGFRRNSSCVDHIAAYNHQTVYGMAVPTARNLRRLREGVR
uniref:hypothetical protein n=1 Tax=Acinetobacter baumannii TaxID=470 RepID=UPI0033911494